MGNTDSLGFQNIYVNVPFHHPFTTTFSKVITIIGINTNCSTIPGTAFSTAPAIKAWRPNADTSKPMQINIAAPQTRRPITIAQSNDTYTLAFFFGSFLCNNPATNPYAANSNAMQSAVGNMYGIPMVKERRIGAINPTANPQGAPQKKPHSNTGICIGQSIDPICGICPVKNGITNAIAKNMADNVRFLISFLVFINSSFLC